MSFHSSTFLFLFLPVFLAVFHLLPRRLRPWWLLAASALFYALWRLDFLALLVVEAAAAWLLGGRIGALRGTRPHAARILLGIGIAAFLLVLAYFKYAGFGVQSLNALLGGLGLRSLPLLRVALPVGISFSTFKAISYLIDVHRGAAVPGSPEDVALYILIFPQVVSGPIDRFGTLAPQLHSDGRSLDGFSRGAMRFMLGLCKKVLIADAIAPLANAAFALDRPGLIDAWLGSAAYTMQLYFDFSGYSDMAIGLGLMLGFSFMENFRAPYLSVSITEFWKRWHISLSSWLRDYLYIPLGGNRKGPARTSLNLLIVMVLGGLWHGAALTFILWGAWHGLLLLIERIAGWGRGPRGLPRPLAVLITMLLVNAGWVLFRATSVASAAGILGGMIGLNGAGLSPALGWQIETLSLAALAAAITAVYMGPWISTKLQSFAASSEGWRRAEDILRLLLLPLFILAILRIAAGSPVVFLYGKF